MRSLGAGAVLIAGAAPFRYLLRPKVVLRGGLPVNRQQGLSRAKANEAFVDLELAAGEVTTEGNRTKPRILVIDDERAIVVAFSRLLGAHYDVVGLTDARQALAQIRDGQRFDVILCDLFMPRMGGREFYSQLRQLGTDATEKIIFLSGGAYTDEIESFLASVPNRTVSKPFDAEELLGVIAGMTR